MTQQYNVIVAPGGVVAAVSREPLRNGHPAGYRAYRVVAESREEAKRVAKERYNRNERDDSACWSTGGA